MSSSVYVCTCNFWQPLGCFKGRSNLSYSVKLWGCKVELRAACVTPELSKLLQTTVIILLCVLAAEMICVCEIEGALQCSQMM